MSHTRDIPWSPLTSAPHGAHAGAFINGLTLLEFTTPSGSQHVVVCGLCSCGTRDIAEDIARRHNHSFGDADDGAVSRSKFVRWLK